MKRAEGACPDLGGARCENWVKTRTEATFPLGHVTASGVTGTEERNRLFI